MSEGDRALDERLALKLGWHDVTESHVTGELIALPPGEKRPPSGNTSRHRVVPHYTGRDWPQLAEALRAKPYECVVSVTWVPAGSDEPAVCKASIIGDGIIAAYFSAGDADTPGLALGRAAEQALGGES